VYGVASLPLGTLRRLLPKPLSKSMVIDRRNLRQVSLADKAY
jgi:hypothetical protein